MNAEQIEHEFRQALASETPWDGLVRTALVARSVTYSMVYGPSYRFARAWHLAWRELIGSINDDYDQRWAMTAALNAEVYLRRKDTK